ncbi:MAG: hypothetical protein ACFFG0_06560 [Candidatus Thorarchaeota archaeon]
MIKCTSRVPITSCMPAITIIIPIRIPNKEENITMSPSVPPIKN